MRSLGRSQARRKRPVESRTLDEKNRQFLAKPAKTWYCLSESPNEPASAFHARSATRRLALSAGNDSEMAPQSVEIAQNGLGDPQRRARWKESRFERIPHEAENKEYTLFSDYWRGEGQRRTYIGEVGQQA
jgi:hypothetical protein